MSVANVDPELLPALQSMQGMDLDLTPEGLGVLRTLLRQVIDGTPLYRPPSVVVEDLRVPGPEGDPEVLLRLYRPATATAPVPLLYWIHGGGLVMGSLDMHDEFQVGVVERLGLALVSVEYRLAPDHPHPAPVEDCYAGLVWMAGHGADYGIDTARIAVGGPSAGGGLAAAVALLARDRGGPMLSFQLLLEPMLDDRCATRSANQYEGDVLWDRNDNRRGWTALLGDERGTDEVSPYASPARATDLTGLPPTLIDVGEVETFRDECFDYARRLAEAGVSTEFHLHRGGFHGFDLLAPESALARQAWDLRWDALTRALGLEPPTV